MFTTPDDVKRYEDLCAKVKDFCAARGWFGAERGPLTDPYVHENLWAIHQQGMAFNFDGFLDENWLLYHANTDITYPPATDAQIRLTEARLGKPLPLLLRFLYERVANGGCAIAGLPGAVGGCPIETPTLWWEKNTPAEIPLRSVEDVLPWTSGAPLPHAVADALARYPGAHITFDYKALSYGDCLWLTEPRECGLLLDGTTGHVYWLDEYWLDEGEGDAVHGDEPYSMSTLACRARTLEEYIERWLLGEEMEPRFVGEIQPLTPDWSKIWLDDVREIWQGD